MYQKIISRHIDGLLDKSKLYTADVFPESAIAKLKSNQRTIQEMDNSDYK